MEMRIYVETKISMEKKLRAYIDLCYIKKVYNNLKSAHDKFEKNDNPYTDF
ncbi:hypothetical protein CWI36_0002p0020 [Hamiltosporidium magnivora]|uniref:Uncharacterized protein n=1 Tax=Hamiltosporidium magnivora TaxID=148818 RepID=A0A4Q9LN64_9MICR|nr:hypothetical protein CWI36_0002p0020 [Hamiltosporidium magnivora]